MITIEDMSFAYEGSDHYILNNINLSIAYGSYISIVGENGSAKSTLIKLILNLLKPIKGSISIKTDTIGYVPQKMDNFNAQFPITVQEMLNCHLKALKIKDKTIIEKSLEKVNMLNFKNHLIGNLSGGQQQKIFIARALIGNPELLVLDEPSTGIDIKSQEEIYSIIKRLNKDLKITVISVEHNLDAVLKNSTHVYELSEGKGSLYTINDYRKHLKNLSIRKVD